MNVAEVRRVRWFLNSQAFFSSSIVSMEVEDKPVWGFSSNQISIPSLGHLHEIVGVHTNGLRMSSATAHAVWL